MSIVEEQESLHFIIFWRTLVKWPRQENRYRLCLPLNDYSVTLLSRAIGSNSLIQFHLENKSSV